MINKRTVWQLLRLKYPETECVLLSEVSDKTGSRNRSADFIVVNLWPSRGNSIIGFERKSYRSDWLNELKNPLKQEAIFKYCDYFYLVTDVEGVAKREEIPVTWGWMHSDGIRLKVMKDAPKLEAVACTRQFICAMLRRAADKQGYIKNDSLEDVIEARAEEKMKKQYLQIKLQLENYESLKRVVDEFEKASGIKLEPGWSQDGKKIGEAVKLIKMTNIEDLIGKLKAQKEAFTRISKQLDLEIETFEKIV